MSEIISTASAKERIDLMKHEEKILLKLADILLQDNLITPEEKYRLKQLIESGGCV